MKRVRIPWRNQKLQDRVVFGLRADFSKVGPGIAAYIRAVLRDVGEVFPATVVKWNWSDAEQPLQATVAELLSAHESSVSRAIREGLAVGCWTGRGDLFRMPLNVGWCPPNDRHTNGMFSVDIELVDVPMERFGNVRRLVDGFFDRAPSAGVLGTAFGSVREVTARWPHQFGESTFKAPMVHVEELGELAGGSPPTVSSLRWITVLGAPQLKCLGGKAAFLARAAAFRAEHDLPALITKANGRDGVLVELGLDVFDPAFAGFDAFEEWQFAVRSNAASWFARELAKAELFSWQHWTLSKSRIVPADHTAFDEGVPDDRTISAARVDASTDQADLWNLLESTPPECFSGTPLKPTTAERRWARSNYGEMTTSFVIADERGRTSLPIWVRFQEECLGATDPIFVGHPSLRDSCFAFQSHRHGYDGKQGHNHWPRRKAPDLFHCPRCGKDRFRALAVFQYSEEMESDPDPRMKRSPQDYFSWLAIRATCSACKWTGTIADIECA